MKVGRDGEKERMSGRVIRRERERKREREREREREDVCMSFLYGEHLYNH